jgi:cytoskeletal protein RodZ
MGTRDPWIFLIVLISLSAVLFLVTVLIAQLETYVPSRKRHELTPNEDDESQQHHDEPTAA